MDLYALGVVLTEAATGQPCAAGTGRYPVPARAVVAS